MRCRRRPERFARDRQRPMPTFCRHNRLLQNCPICAREQAIELRPVVSAGAPHSSSPPSSRSRTAPARARTARAQPGGLRVRKLARGVDDGYRCRLVPGLKSSAEAERLADELAFAAGRLERLAQDPPGLYAEVADQEGDLEERTWLAFLIAYLCPLDREDPFAELARVRTPWASDESPNLDDVRGGPRGAHDSERGSRTIDAYRAWAQRAGSQAAAFRGDAAWTGERRFARAFERLALPGLHRDARFDLLATLGSLRVYELRAGSLQLGGENRVTLAAKRSLGIGDPLLLERRAAELARACELPLAALDLGLDNWERGERARLGLEPHREPEPGALARTRAALDL